MTTLGKVEKKILYTFVKQLLLEGQWKDGEKYLAACCDLYLALRQAFRASLPAVLFPNFFTPHAVSAYYRLKG